MSLFKKNVTISENIKKSSKELTKSTRHQVINLYFFIILRLLWEWNTFFSSLFFQVWDADIRIWKKKSQKWCWANHYFNLCSDEQAPTVKVRIRLRRIENLACSPLHRTSESKWIALIFLPENLLSYILHL